MADQRSAAGPAACPTPTFYAAVSHAHKFVSSTASDESRRTLPLSGYPQSSEQQEKRDDRYREADKHAENKHAEFRARVVTVFFCTGHQKHDQRHCKDRGKEDYRHTR